MRFKNSIVNYLPRLVSMARTLSPAPDISQIRETCKPLIFNHFLIFGQGGSGPFPESSTSPELPCGYKSGLAPPRPNSCRSR